MEKPARLQTVLPDYTRRGTARVINEKQFNARSIPFLDGEYNQWYLVGRFRRGIHWRPYTVTVIVLECVMLFISMMFMVKTMHTMNFDRKTVHYSLIEHRNILARQQEEWSAQLVRAFDDKIASPQDWLNRLLLSVSTSQIAVSLLAITLLTGQEKRLRIWISFSLHVICAASLVPFATDVMAKEVIGFGGFYSLFAKDGAPSLHIDEHSFLKVWVQSASFYEKRFMRFRSEDTLIRSLEREIGCCGMKSVNEYSWQQNLEVFGPRNSFMPPIDFASFQRYILNDWRAVEYRKSKQWMALPQTCCEDCLLDAVLAKRISGEPMQQQALVSTNNTSNFTSFTCLSKMEDLQVYHLYPIYALASLMFVMNVLLCIFIGMRNFCKWVTEGTDEEKYIEEIKQAKVFRDKLRDRKRVLNEGANEIYNTKIQVDRNRNRLATQTQITQYVPTHKKKHRRKHATSFI